jgi:hypothetical protein
MPFLLLVQELDLRDCCESHGQQTSTRVVFTNNYKRCIHSWAPMVKKNINGMDTDNRLTAKNNN